jgi:hypothetical protein
MKQLHFFALRDDIIPVLKIAEQGGSLRYIRIGQYIDTNFESYDQGEDIFNLGRAGADSASNGYSFLVFSRETIFNPRRVDTLNGGRRYLVDQLANPDTVTFDPGGLWGEDVIISGRVATVSDSALARELMTRFNAAISKSFRKIKAFRVGCHAQSLLESGARLTSAVQSPREYDLYSSEIKA